MKTTDCLILLGFVPDSIKRNTDGAIDEGMFLTGDAVNCLLKGEMFSVLDCMWHYATLISRADAEQAIRQLKEYNIVGEIIKII